MQADRLADLAKRRAGFLRAGEALASGLGVAVDLGLSLRELRLRAMRIRERLPLGVCRHRPETIRRPSTRSIVRMDDSADAQAMKVRRREAAERLRGLFAHVAPGRSLADELIADRRAEVRAEEREAEEEAHRLRGPRYQR